MSRKLSEADLEAGYAALAAAEAADPNYGDWDEDADPQAGCVSGAADAHVAAKALVQGERLIGDRGNGPEQG